MIGIYNIIFVFFKLEKYCSTRNPIDVILLLPSHMAI